MLTKVVGKLMELSDDERARMQEEYREKWRRDQVSRERWVLQKGIQEGEAKGRAEGKAEGKAEGRTETIKEMVGKLRTKGRSDAEIAELLELSVEEVGWL